MKFAQARELSKPKFKRLTGMSPRTYYVIVNGVKKQEKNKKKPGRPCSLSVEEQVLMTIQQGARISTLFSDWS